MSLIEIRCRWNTTKVLFSSEATTLAEAVTAAVAAGTNLTGADLARANLTRADLTGANTCDAANVPKNVVYEKSRPFSSRRSR